MLCRLLFSGLLVFATWGVHGRAFQIQIQGSEVLCLVLGIFQLSAPSKGGSQDLCGRSTYR